MAIRGHKPWNKIITSPLSRCAEFAHTLAQDLNIPIRQETNFMEIALGTWEGKSTQQLVLQNKN